MNIKSKKHSNEVIKMLNLNRVPENVFPVYNEQMITEFCLKNPSSMYILRDVENPSGNYYLCKTKEDCIINAKNYTGAFSLGISCFAYTNIVLLGEIVLTKNDITIVATDDKTLNHRTVYQNPIINKTTTIEDNSLFDIDGVELVINYLAEHNLYDVIVEFVVYDKPVGTNNDKVLIVELRSNY